MVAEPFVGSAVTVQVGAAPSMSVEVAVPVMSVSSTLVPLKPPVMTGASFVDVTVMVTVAVSVPPLPSDTSMMNVVVPDQLALGVKIQTPVVGSMVAVPVAGAVVTVQVGSAPSMSVEMAVPVTSVSSSLEPVRPPVMAGSSLTGVTVTATVSVVTPPLLSSTWMSKVSVPDQSASGV